MITCLSFVVQIIMVKITIVEVPLVKDLLVEVIIAKVLDVRKKERLVDNTTLFCRSNYHGQDSNSGGFFSLGF